MSHRSARMRASYASKVWAWDAALTLLALGLILASALVGVRVNEISDTAGPALRDSLFWVAVLALPLVLRRRAPATSFLLVTGAFAVVRWLIVPEYSVSTFVYFLSLASAGSWIRPARQRLVVRSIGVVVMAAVLVADMVRTEVPEGFEGIVNTALTFAVAFNLAFFIAGWVLGDILRTRREREEALVERTHQLEVERELRARRAVLDERLRIARELHDVVAHHVSVMGVQAGGARRVLDRDPEAAAAALGTIETSSRQAIDELRRLVSFLRTEGESDSLMPQPGVDRLPELVDDARRSGLTVDQRIDGEPRPLPGSVDVSVFRVVQEALTNTRKHAQASHARVTVRFGGDAVEVEVIDDGTASHTPVIDGTGHGIAGMRERVALHGGELTVGRTDQGGFRVHARFPTGATT